MTSSGMPQVSFFPLFNFFFFINLVNKRGRKHWSDLQIFAEWAEFTLENSAQLQNKNEVENYRIDLTDRNAFLATSFLGEKDQEKKRWPKLDKNFHEKSYWNSSWPQVKYETLKWDGYKKDKYIFSWVNRNVVSK